MVDGGNTDRHRNLACEQSSIHATMTHSRCRTRPRASNMKLCHNGGSVYRAAQKLIGRAKIALSYSSDDCMAYSGAFSRKLN